MTGNKFLVIFSGEIDSKTNQSWCSDCVEAAPSIKRITDACGDERVILKGVVTQREWSGNANHRYRQAPFGAQGVPTVILYENMDALHRVDDLAQFANNDLMDMFLDDM